VKQSYAEDVNYWQTSRSSSDTWIDRAKAEIAAAGGNVLGDAYGNFGSGSAFMLAFELGGQQYKITWPVLESRMGKHKAAKVQAATMLYHDVKSKSVAAKVLGRARRSCPTYYYRTGAPPPRTYRTNYS